MGNKMLVHRGKVFHWRCTWANGDYYENENNFVLTQDGTVAIYSSRARDPKELDRRVFAG